MIKIYEVYIKLYNFLVKYNLCLQHNIMWLSLICYDLLCK